MFIIPAKARNYVLPALVCLSVCLFVCYHDNLIKRRRIWTNYLGRFLGGKASPSSFLVTIASRVWRLLSKNAVNRGFLRFSGGVLLGVGVESVLGEWALSMVRVRRGANFAFAGICTLKRVLSL